VKRLWCQIVGHRYETRTYDHRGKRTRIVKCGRCSSIDHAQTLVVPWNRKARRRWARNAAREVARA
jgi:hypothetical protein